MNDDLRDRLLGSGTHDSGCESGFEVVDQYVEAVLQGLDVAQLFPEVVAHLRSCAACREDTEGLIAALRLQAPAKKPR